MRYAQQCPQYCPNTIREFSDTPLAPGTPIAPIMRSQNHVIHGPDTTAPDAAFLRMLSTITLCSTPQLRSAILQHHWGAPCPFPRLLALCVVPQDHTGPPGSPALYTHSSCHTTPPPGAHHPSSFLPSLLISSSLTQSTGLQW